MIWWFIITLTDAEIFAKMIRAGVCSGVIKAVSEFVGGVIWDTPSG